MNFFKSFLSLIILVLSLSACEYISKSSSNVSSVSTFEYKKLYTADTIHSLTSGTSILLRIAPMEEKNLPDNMNVSDSKSDEFYSPSRETVISFSNPDKTTVTEKRPALPDQISYNFNTRLILTRDKKSQPADSGSYFPNLNAEVLGVVWTSDTSMILRIHPIKKLAQIKMNVYSELIDRDKTVYLDVKFRNVFAKKR